MTSDDMEESSASQGRDVWRVEQVEDTFPDPARRQRLWRQVTAFSTVSLLGVVALIVASVLTGERGLVGLAVLILFAGAGAGAASWTRRSDRHGAARRSG